MWLLPRLRLALARRPWSYWLLVAFAAAFAWWQITSLHDDARHARDAWGRRVDVWVARSDASRGGIVDAERRTLPAAAVPVTVLDELMPDQVAARDIAAGAVLVPGDVSTARVGEGSVIVAIVATAPALVPGDDVTVFDGGRAVCDGVVDAPPARDDLDASIELAVPPECAAALSASGLDGDLLVGRRP
jgi:hypothetical protein